MSTKICPTCSTKNSSSNLKCIKCYKNMIYVEVAKEWTEENNKHGFKKNYFLDEFLSTSLFIRLFVGFFSAYIFCLTFNSLFLVFTIILVGTFFLPRERDYLNITELFEWFYLNYKRK